MKKVFLLIIAVSFGMLSHAQVPPQKVLDGFLKKFKETTNVKWEQEEPNEWEAEFKVNNKKMSASFDASGKWLETEVKISKKDISAEAHKAINLKFEGWEFEKIESVETPDFKGYEIVLEKEDTETEILVSVSGEITIKKVNVEEDDEDEDDHED